MTYKENATLGVGKLDYIIASGIKQKNIQDQLYLEQFLKLDALVPMQTSYTQTAEDRKSEEAGTGNSSKDRISHKAERIQTVSGHQTFLLSFSMLFLPPSPPCF